MVMTVLSAAGGGGQVSVTDVTHTESSFKYVKKLKPDKFFMGKPVQNYGVSPDQMSHNFTCSPT